MEPMLIISPGMEEYPELVDRICYNDGIGLQAPGAGLIPKTDNPDPDDWMEAVAWLCLFDEEGNYHIQLVSEPFPEGLREEHMTYLSTFLEDTINEFIKKYPDAEVPENALDEARLMRRRAETQAHDISTEQIKAIMEAARSTGCTPAAIREIVMSICDYEIKVAFHLLGRETEDWFEPVSPELARSILEYAQQQGADPYAVQILAEAMGSGYWKPGSGQPEARLTEETRAAIWEAAKTADIPWWATEKAVTA